MSRIDDFWNAKAQEIRSQFDQNRLKHTDSAVKGGQNERIISEPLKDNFAPRGTDSNVQIVDSTGRSSDEVDVVLRNAQQPFATSSLLIAEGVDVAVQVKAILSTNETSRMVKNCKSVKTLERLHDTGSRYVEHQSDEPHFVTRIPYFCFAFGSEITAATALEALQHACDEVPSELQPDGLFVLDKFSIINLRNNDGVLRVGRDDARGFVVEETAQSTLARMLWTLYATIIPVERDIHAIRAYGPPGPSNFATTTEVQLSPGHSRPRRADETTVRATIIKNGRAFLERSCAVTVLSVPTPEGSEMLTFGIDRPLTREWITEFAYFLSGDGLGVLDGSRQFPVYVSANGGAPTEVDFND